MLQLINQKLNSFEICPSNRDIHVSKQLKLKREYVVLRLFDDKKGFGERSGAKSVAKSAS
jgi:hypothetical protein